MFCVDSSLAIAIKLILCVVVLLAIKGEAQSSQDWINQFKPKNPVSFGSSTTKPPTDLNQGCGLRNEYGMTRILNPEEEQAQAGEFPWLVAVYKYNPVLRMHVYLCAGSLIHRRVVLSVAHRFVRVQPSTIQVRAGDWDLSRNNENYVMQPRGVESIIIHPQHDGKSHANSAALLFLSSEVTVAPNVKFACLPPPRTVTDPGTRCVVSGWGKDKFNGTMQTIQKLVEVPVVRHSDCQTIFRRKGDKPQYVLPESVMCAGGEPNKDACIGDGGSPLDCLIPGSNRQYYQVGIVSFGFQCGLDGVPGAYTDVAYLRSWIDQTLTTKGYTSESYTP